MPPTDAPISAKLRDLRLVGRSCVALALAAAVIGVSTGPAAAAPDGDTEANAVVESGMTLTALTGSFNLTGTPGATVQTVTPVTYTVETNNPTGYTVTVESTSGDMAPADPVANPDVIPIADLTVQESGEAGYDPVTFNGAPVLVHSQTGRSANGGDDLSTDYQMRIPTVTNDTYSATLNYMAAAQL